MKSNSNLLLLQDTNENYICTLSSDLILKAQKNLHEKNEWRSRDIDALRQIVILSLNELNEQYTLRPCLSESFLIRFLRARKFDYDRALQLLLHYYEVRRDNCDVFADLVPSKLLSILFSTEDIFSFLPNVDYKGGRILLLDLGFWHPQISSIIDLFRVLVLILESALCDETTQVSGFSVVVDIRSVPTSILIHKVKPSLIRKLNVCFEHSFPARLTGIHIVHESCIMDMLMMALTPFISDGTRRKLHCHGVNPNSLYDYFDRDSLPSSLNGMMNRDIRLLPSAHLLALDLYFQKLATFGFENNPSNDRAELFEHLSDSLWMVENDQENNRRSLCFQNENSVQNDDQSSPSDLKYCHRHLDSQHDDRAEKVLIFVSSFTALFVTIEFAGGYLAQSLAIMSDAGHMLSDLMGFLISLAAIYVARRPPTRRFSFGFHRAEVLGAVCSIALIWLLTIVLVYLAILRIIRSDYHVDADIMILTACISVVFNIMSVTKTMGAVLHFGGGHCHSHGHRANSSKCHNVENDRSFFIDNLSHVQSRPNINVRAAFIHVLGDFIQSIGVLIAAVIIKFTSWQLADPLCTFFFSIVVLLTTMTVMKDAVLVLMEGHPRDFDYWKVRNELQLIKGVKTVHSLHVWSLTTDTVALTVHLIIASDVDALQVMQDASRLVRHKYAIHFATVQVGRFDSSLAAKCDQCVEQMNEDTR